MLARLYDDEGRKCAQVADGYRRSCVRQAAIVERAQHIGRIQHLGKALVQTVVEADAEGVGRHGAEELGGLGSGSAGGFTAAGDGENGGGCKGQNCSNRFRQYHFS